MPTTTWTNARADILRPLGYVSVATTTNITTNTSIISTELADDYPEDGTFIGWFCKIVLDSDGGTPANDGITRRVTAYTASSGTLTVAGANLSAEDEAVEIILTRFHPDGVLDKYNQVRSEVYPKLSVIKNHETIVTGQSHTRFTLPSTLRGKPLQVLLGTWQPVADTAVNLSVDGGFEAWDNSTTLTNYSLSGTGASVNQEEETTSPSNYMVLEGDFSARVVTASSGATTLLETVTPSVATQSVEANVAVWVYCTTASRVSAQVASTSGDTHTGTGWELLYASATLAYNATNFTWGVGVTAGSQLSIYVDDGIATLGQSEPHDVPWEPQYNWRWIQPVDGASNGGLLEFPRYLPEHRRLRIIGRYPLSSISADTGTIELDHELIAPLYNLIRERLCEEAANLSVSNENRQWWHSRQREYRASAMEGMEGVVQVMPAQQIRIPDM
jgi:hypothetical protein